MVHLFGFKPTAGGPGDQHRRRAMRWALTDHRLANAVTTVIQAVAG